MKLKLYVLLNSLKYEKYALFKFTLYGIRQISELGFYVPLVSIYKRIHFRSDNLKIFKSFLKGILKSIVD